jgi:hypothetical protein
MLYGIDVIIIGPGSTATPIWDKAEQVDMSLYAETDYIEAIRRAIGSMTVNGKKGLPPERVSEVVLRALTTPRPRVRYAVTRRSFINRFLMDVLPKRLIDGFIARSLRLK